MNRIIKLNSPEELIGAIRQVRKAKKISQSELSGFSNITIAAISRIENLETDPQISTVFRLIRLLNLEIYIKDSSNE